MLRIAGWAFLGISLAGVVWEWLSVYGTHEFFGERPPPDPPGGPEDLPTAAVLVPLKGAAECNRRSLQALLAQDYPCFEVIVGMESNDHAAQELVESMRDGSAGRSIRAVPGENRLGGRPKVGNLQNALETTDAPVLVMVDADVLVETGFLRTMIAPLSDGETGLTTCLYRGDGAGGIWSQVDGIWNTTSYLPSALFARRIIGESFAFGAAIAMRRDVLEEIGGFRAIAGRVGDDYQLGNRTAAAGYAVHFVQQIVTEQLGETDFLTFANRRVRWSRTIRTFQPAGYAGSIVMLPVPVALIAALLKPTSHRRWWWLAFVLANRMSAAALNRRWFEPAGSRNPLWLVPLRDVIALGVWALGFTPARKKLSSLSL